MKKVLIITLTLFTFFACKDNEPKKPEPFPINPTTPEVTKEDKWVTYTLDSTSILKNPAMGWVMYEEGWSFRELSNWNIYTPELFWQQMEEANAPAYSNILYIRILWKDLEPEEGRYAWLYDDKYKWYIQKAKDHGLKLAFRVFYHGANGVPDYVYKAGATKTGIDNEGKVQPHYDHPVFLAKLSKFIEAFAQEYDNPDVVDFIDAYGIGRWGEGHGITLRNSGNLEKVIKTITETYAKNFKNVLTVINLSGSDYKITKPHVFDKLGFLPRRDGIGSHWYSDQERNWLKNELFPEKAFIGEGCYWFNSAKGDNSKYNAFKNDPRFKMDNFKEAFTVAVTDALNNHSNTFDLRVPLQCKFWIEELPDQVQRFITLGGYRLYPDYIKLERKGEKLVLLHAWKNYGVGVLPNNHVNWNHKYQVSFALLNKDNEVKFLFTDPKIEPADWLKGNVYSYATMFDIPTDLKGEYTLCVGITDKTKDNMPGIDLAVSKDLKIGKWVKVTDVTFENKEEAKNE